MTNLFRQFFQFHTESQQTQAKVREDTTLFDFSISFVAFIHNNKSKDLGPIHLFASGKADDLMPPPPPSKSYLLVFDTDSEDEDDQDERMWQRQQQLEQMQRQQRQLQEQLERQQQQQPVMVPSRSSQPAENHSDIAPTHPVPASSSSGHRRPHVIDDDEDDDSEDGPSSSSGINSSSSKTTTTVEDNDDDNEDNDEDEDEPMLTKSQKKNKKKRRKKKKKRSGSPSDVKKKDDRRVAFASVSIQNYNRCFGTDVVPGDGGWPLGMELKPPSSNIEEKEEFRIQLPIEDYETMKQERLQARWEVVQEKFPDEKEILSLMTRRPENDPTPFALETRQWDYRHKVKNPLFRVLHEEDRRAIFLGQTATAATPPPPTRRERSASFEGGDLFPPSSSSGSSSDPSSGSSSGSSSPPSKRRGRSNSVADNHSSNSKSSGESFSDTYDQVYVHHVRNELEQIRVQRTMEGAAGCDCRKLSVYIPPKDGGGKRAQHRRLKPQKLTQELKKRNLYDPKASREESEIILHKAVEDEPCCSRDCSCARDGTGCQADTCSCWHDSHVQDKKSNNSQSTSTRSSSSLNVSEIKRRCGNQYGMCAVDGSAIDKKRVQILSHLNLTFCQPVGAVVEV